MKKAGTVLIILLFMGALAGNAFCEEVAKEGSIMGKSYLAGTSKVLPMGDERIQMNFEGSGVFVSDNGKGFLHNSAMYAIGTMHAVKGVFEESGFMVQTATDGDKVYATWKGSGTFGKAVTGTFTYTGGTGKFTGIEGGGEFTRYALADATEGVWTSVSLAKANYKLP